MVNVVFWIHLFLFVAILVVPFLPLKTHRHNLEFYSLLVPFLFFHWSVNDDTCFLTEVEKRVTGKTETKETFFGRIVSPIYKMEDTHANNMLKTVLFTLWFWTQYRLGRFDVVEKDVKMVISKIKSTP